MAMTLRQLILGKIAEEAAEIAQVALKAQQFGLEDINPKKSISNLQDLQMELTDLQGVVHMLFEDLREEGTMFVTQCNEASINTKIAKVAKWAKRMQERGQVNLDTNSLPAWFIPFWNNT